MWNCHPPALRCARTARCHRALPPAGSDARVSVPTRQASSPQAASRIRVSRTGGTYLGKEVQQNVSHRSIGCEPRTETAGDGGKCGRRHFWPPLGDGQTGVTPYRLRNVARPHNPPEKFGVGFAGAGFTVLEVAKCCSRLVNAKRRPRDPAALSFLSRGSVRV